MVRSVKLAYVLCAYDDQPPQSLKNVSTEAEHGHFRSVSRKACLDKTAVRSL